MPETLATSDYTGSFLTSVYDSFHAWPSKSPQSNFLGKGKAGNAFLFSGPPGKPPLGPGNVLPNNVKIHPVSCYCYPTHNFLATQERLIKNV
jgi:hypothetical protein